MCILVCVCAYVHVVGMVSVVLVEACKVSFRENIWLETECGFFSPEKCLTFYFCWSRSEYTCACFHLLPGIQLFKFMIFWFIHCHFSLWFFFSLNWWCIFWLANQVFISDVFALCFAQIWLTWLNGCYISNNLPNFSTDTLPTFSTDSGSVHVKFQITYC